MRRHTVGYLKLTPFPVMTLDTTGRGSEESGIGRDSDESWMQTGLNIADGLENARSPVESVCGAPV